MKKYLIGLFLIGIMGCNNTEEATPTPPSSTAVKITTTDSTVLYRVDGHDLTVYIIDGCEYLGYDIGYDHGLLFHKGNCKNPIHNSH